MTNEIEFEQEIKLLISALEKEREKIDRRVELAMMESQEIQGKIDSLERTRAIYKEHYGLPDSRMEISEELRRKFEGLSTKDALIRIAADNHDILQGSAACAILVRAGMFKDQRNASANVYSTLSRNPNIFRKVARGKYELIRSAAKTAPTSAPSAAQHSTSVDKAIRDIAAVAGEHSAVAAAIRKIAAASQPSSAAVQAMQNALAAAQPSSAAVQAMQNALAAAQPSRAVSEMLRNMGSISPPTPAAGDAARKTRERAGPSTEKTTE